MAFQFVRRAAMMVAAVASLTSFGGVFDDAILWWRGACDENKDGLITANEVYNTLIPKTDTDYQRAELTGTCDYKAVNEEVISCWSNATNEFPVIRQPQDPEDKAVASGNSIRFRMDRTTMLSTNINAITYFIRFKWDGDYGTLNTEDAYLFDNVDWYWSRGIKLLIRPDGHLRLFMGRRNFDYTNGTATIEPNVWYDFFVRINDPTPDSTAGHNAGCNFVYFKSSNVTGGVYQIWPGSGNTALWLTPGTGTEFFGCRSITLKTTDTVAVGAGFKGDIAQFALWPRCLSDNELREASAAGDMAPTLFTLGRPDGSNGEFARENSVAASSVTLPGSWDFVPPELNAAFPSFDIVFKEKGFGVHDGNSGTSKFSYWSTQPHVLVLKTVPGSAEGCVSVTLDKGTDKQIKLGRRRLQPGVAEYFYVKELPRTTHTLTIKRLEGAVSLDYVELYGAFCPGARCYSYFVDNNNQYTGSLIGLPLEANTPLRMSAACTIETDPYDSTKGHTIVFDMPEDFAKLAYNYNIATGQTNGSKTPNVVLYINGTEFGRYSGQYQFSSFNVSIPENTFKPGRNEIGWRFDSGKHASDFWMGIRGHYLTPVETSLPEAHPYLPGFVLKLK